MRFFDSFDCGFLVICPLNKLHECHIFLFLNASNCCFHNSVLTTFIIKFYHFLHLAATLLYIYMLIML